MILGSFREDEDDDEVANVSLSTGASRPSTDNGSGSNERQLANNRPNSWVLTSGAHPVGQMASSSVPRSELPLMPGPNPAQSKNVPGQKENRRSGLWSAASGD